MMTFIRQLIYEGKVPYMMKLKTLLLIIALIAPLSVFFIANEFEEFGSIGWALLVSVLAIRPLSQIFPDLRILSTLIVFRREVGIASGLFIVAHFIGYTIAADTTVLEVIKDPLYWDFSTYFAWGMLGLAFAIPVLLTSNNFSMRLLKKRWKTVQHLSYLFFFFGGIHIGLVGEASGFIGIVIVGILLLLAKFRFKIRIPKL